MEIFQPDVAEKVKALFNFRADVAHNGGFPAGKAQLGEKGSEIPDGHGVNFRDWLPGETDGPGYGIQPGSVAGGAGKKLIFLQFLPGQFQFLFFFRLVLGIRFWRFGENRTVPLALRAPTMWAVEGKHPRVQFVKRAVGFRAKKMMAVDGAFAAGIDSVERAPSQCEGLGDEGG